MTVCAAGTSAGPEAPSPRARVAGEPTRLSERTYL
jgi:hypothetical protein